MYKFLIVSLMIFCPWVVNAQSVPFSIYLEPINIPNLGGVQSFAYGQHGGKWLIVGGRLDGLHRRQPFASFDSQGNNNQLLVIDPITKQKWVAPLTSLPNTMQEQLSSTNMEFHQDSSYLYVMGGYGYSSTSNAHKTYNYLTAIDVPNVIQAVINGTPLQSHFRQIADDKFSVTGGQLEKIGNTYYLVGGHKFNGSYNPMGPTHGPGFSQQYTNEIRRFTIQDNGLSLVINHLVAINDSVKLHRRDYNMLPQIMPNGKEGLTIFSGVFQPTADVPYLTAINIDSAAYKEDSLFAQYYNHYHCAKIALYSGNKNEMYNLFFGGIAQYYDSLGILTQDNNVPFVKTIAGVLRGANGRMSEHKFATEMPTLLGAGSELIPAQNISKYRNSIVKFDDLQGDSILVGYIFGGISSSAANIFWVNNGTQSIASNQIFKVFLIKNRTTNIHTLNEQSNNGLKMQVYPNPNDGDFTIRFNLLSNAESEIILSITDISGKKIKETKYQNLSIGEHLYNYHLDGIENGGTYIVILRTKNEQVMQKIIVTP